MLAKLSSATLCGMDACPVEVEVDLASTGMPHYRTVGLPDATLRESKERIRAALRNIGFAIPSHPLTVNLGARGASEVGVVLRAGDCAWRGGGDGEVGRRARGSS